MPTRWFSGAHAIHARRERQDPLAVKDSQAQDIQVTGRDSGFDRVSILSSARQRRVGRPTETRTAIEEEVTISLVASTLATQASTLPSSHSKRSIISELTQL